MNIIGVILIAIGFMVLLAGLTGLALARWGGQRVRRYNVIKLSRTAILASAAAPLMVLGSMVSDPRHVSNLLGTVLLTVSLVTVIVVFSLPLVNRVRGKGSTTKAIISGAVAALTIGLLVWLIFVTGDFPSLLIFFGYVFLLLGAVVAATGLLWLVVQLIRRRGRIAAMAFMWSAASLAIFGFIGMAILAPLAPSVPDTMSSPGELDLFLTDLIDSGSPPGISLVVVKEGETVYNKAFGVADGPNSFPATPDTVYHWFSITKIFTAVATMQLVEQGLINLDDPVSDYLSFFEPDYPSVSSEPVTIANLLNHSSGLRDNMPEVYGWMHLEDEESVDQTELLRKNLFRYDELMFEPGSKAVYTNTAYYTLGALIEKVKDQTYEEYVIDHVLDPLGMVNTRFEYTESMRANEGVGAHPMADLNTVFLSLTDPPWPSDYIREYDNGWIWFNRYLFDGNPPSGLIGPAPDMARFITAILNGGELDGTRILSQESIDTMLSNRHVELVITAQTTDYGQFDEVVQGLGWKVVRDGGRLYYSHGGGGAGFKTLMRLYPDDDLGIGILGNGTKIEVQALADAVAEIEW